MISKRWSCRNFDSAKSVSKEQINQLLDLAIKAPSAGNVQPWIFYIVQDIAIKQKLVAAAGYQSFISQAPVVIIVCADLEKSLGAYGSRGKDLYSIQDTSAAIQNILLGSVDIGLAACWVGAFDEAMVSHALNLPAYQRPMAIIPIGYSNTTSKKRPRKPIEDVTKYID